MKRPMYRLSGKIALFAVFVPWLLFGPARADHGGSFHIDLSLSVPSTNDTGNYAVNWNPGPVVQLEEKFNGGAYASVYSGSVGSTSFVGKANGTYTYRLKFTFCYYSCVTYYTAPKSVTVSVGFPAPSAITGPSNDANGTFALNWGSVSGATRYQLLRRVDGGSWATIQNNTATARSETSLADGVWQYRVRACLPGECSGWTPIKTVNVARKPGVPGTITGPDSVRPNSSFTLNWTTAPGRVSRYQLQQRAGSAWSTVQNTAATSKTISIATEGRYYFRVRACNTVGTYSNCGAWSASKIVDVQNTIDYGLAAPANSITGAYTVTWTSSLLLTLQERVDGSAWVDVYVGTGGSRSFSGKPNGSYNYRLKRVINIPRIGETFYLYSASITVDVGNIAEPPIAGTVVAGSLPYETGVTKGGNAYINIPIEAAPGVNGLQPSLSIAYSSGRDRQRLDEDLPGDYLGYGWRVAGFSSIRRCVKDRNNSVNISLSNSDSLCLNGEPLVLVAGQNWSPGAEYRTMRESYHKIVLQGSGGQTWFEVHTPDGSVVEFGNSNDSRVRSISYVFINGRQREVPTLPYLWSISRQLDSFGNEMRYTYYKDEVAGVSHPASIVYGNNEDAEVRFEYVGRNDLEPVQLGAATLDQPLLLHTVRVSLANKTVREYRLQSETGPQGWRRLNRVQACGYDENGITAECLQPLDLDWAQPAAALPDLKTFVERLTDSNGMVTEFTHAVMTASGSHPFLFTERPFGNASLPANSQLLPAAPDGSLKCVVTELRRSNGIGGWHRTSYAYQGRGLESIKNWGYLGFYASRETDEQSGIVTYNQYRLDFPHFSEVSATHQYNAPFGSHTQLLTRSEVAYADTAISHGATTTYLPYRSVSTTAVLENGTQLGVMQRSNSLTLNAAGFVVDLENSTTIAGVATPSGPGGSVWGRVPSYTLGAIKRTVQTDQSFDNNTSGSNWLIGFQDEIETRHYRGTATSGPLDQSQRVTFSRYANTNEVATQVNYPQDPTYQLTVTNRFDNRGYVERQTVSGANVASRTNFTFNYVQGRYPAIYRNAIGHDTNVSYDNRFGFEKTLTDPNSRTTQIRYDGFGREISRTTPDGVVVATQYKRCSQIGCASVNGVAPTTRVRTTSAVTPTTSEYRDKLGRLIRTETQAFKGSPVIRQDTIYDAQGRVARVSQPYLSNSGAHYIDYDYDLRNRIRRVDRPDGGHTTVGYTLEPAVGVRMTVTESVRDSAGVLADTQTKVNKFNLIGELVSTTDGFGSLEAVTTDYAFFGSGLVQSATVDPSGASLRSSFAYDDAGLRTSITGPDIGTVTFKYTALGELREQRDNAQNVIAFGYDKLGRLTTQSDPDDTATWNYDPANGIGAIGTRTYGTGFVETFAYNNDARVKTVNTSLQGGGHNKTYVHSYLYDTHGRVDRVTDPSGKQVRYGFNNRGYLATVTDTSTNTVLKTFSNVDAFGNVTSELYGNGVQTARAFDPKTGRITDIDTTLGGTVIQNDEYRWQSNDILESRVQRDGGTTRREEFNYDNLNRIKFANTYLNGLQTASRSLSSNYDLRGNLLYKTSSVSGDTDTTSYLYGARDNKLHNVTIDGVLNILAYDANGNIIKYTRSGDDKFIDWNARNLPEAVVVGNSRMDSTPTAKDEFAYGPDGQRFYKKSTWDDNGTQWVEHTFYVGGFEELLTDFNDLDHKAVQKSRIGSNILHVKTIDYFNVADSSIEYLHRDHLGSVEAVTDENGQELRVLAYDPFGERRKDDWQRQLSVSEIYSLSDDQRKSTSRGFTGHENLDRTGFVHMNGRIYDPTLGRFLSPDPVVQSPAHAQSWNRYSYVMNSPVSFSDPTGFFRQPSNPNDYCAVSPVCMNLNDNAGVGAGGSNTRSVDVPYTRTVIFVFVSIRREYFYVPGFGGGDINNGLFSGRFDSILVFDVFIEIDRFTEIRTVQIPDDTPTDEPIHMSGAEVGRFENEIDFAKALGAGIFNEFVVAPIKDAAEGRLLSAGCKLVKVCSAGQKLLGAGKRLFNKLRGRGDVPEGGLKSAAKEIREAGVHPAARNQRVIAVGEDANGNVFAGSSGGFDKGQRAAADARGVQRVPSRAGNHAEENLLDAVPDLKRVGTDKLDPCSNCLPQLIERGVKIDN